MTVFGVESETGLLRQVIVHRPGRELDRLDPDNRDFLLFDDVLWTGQAQKDHDAFTAALRGEDVEVLHFHELLEQTLAVPEAREYVSAQTFDERWYGITGNQVMREYADALSPAGLADLLIAGITKDELFAVTGDRASTYFTRVDGDFMLLRCLPNHLFARDSSCWIYEGVSVPSMQMVARQRETVNVEAVYRWHPRFAGRDLRYWSGGMADGPATAEGGDIEVIGNGAVLVGISQRTTAAGAERLARSLLWGSEQVDRVIGLMMRELRAQMHLDTVLTMLDAHTFLKYKHLGMLPSVTITRGERPGDIHVERHPGEHMHQVMARALGLEEVRVLTAAEDNHAARRGQWNDACNVLAVGPGVLIGYDRNERTLEYLRAEGYRVLPVPGAELGRGRGGPRCMSCPTIREAVPAPTSGR